MTAYLARPKFGNGEAVRLIGHAIRNGNARVQCFMGYTYPDSRLAYLVEFDDGATTTAYEEQLTPRYDPHDPT